METAHRQHPFASPSERPATTAQGQDTHAPRASRAFATEYVSEAFRTALSTSGANVEGFGAERVEAALSEEGASCVILWQDPAERVAAGMEAGQDLGEVAEAWLMHARNLLGLFRAHRRRLRLVDARVLKPDAPQAEREALRTRLQLTSLAAPTEAPQDSASRMAQLLASLVLARIPAIRKCLDELEASSLSLAPEDFSIADLSAVGGRFKSLSDKAARLELLSEENTLLRSQIVLQQKEIDRLLEEHRFASLASEKSLARALADLRVEAKSRTRLQNERDRLAREVRKLSRKLDQVFASTSWKVTKPLRAMKLGVSGGARPADEMHAKGTKEVPKR
jgi:hypothetical protein